MNPEPVTGPDAAAAFRRSRATIRKWAERYDARVLGKHNRRTIYDLADLATIERCIQLGEEVPATPEARDRLRASYATLA